ncbi:MAG: AAA family ATPase [Candidatus Zixiibacteriota bacterium]
MDRLAALLGQDKLAEKIGHYLAGGGKLGLLSGPSGSGKTSVAKLVVEQWPGDVHQLSGQRKFTTIPLLAAHRALDGKRPRRSARDLERNELVDFARDIPVLGNTVAMLAKQMIARSDYQGPDFLSPDEQDLLAGFQRNSLSDSVLFVIEDLQWLDSATIDLLLKMTLPDVAAAYPFIPLSSFLLVKTTDQYEEPSTPQLGQLTAHAAGTFVTTYPSRQAFPDVIRLMGLESVPDRMVCDKLHELTRGHLRLAREIVRLLQEGRISSEEVTSRREQDINQLAGSLLRIRLSDLPKESDRLERLLTIAACIGRSFTRRELQCAFKVETGVEN